MTNMIKKMGLVDFILNLPMRVSESLLGRVTNSIIYLWIQEDFKFV